jgi:hypothetical protein
MSPYPPVTSTTGVHRGSPPPLHVANTSTDRPQDQPTDKQPVSARTPSHSISSGSNSRPMSQQWTPPSQRPGATPTYQQPSYPLPPPRQEEPKPKWPTAVHQTPQEFQNQLTYAPSIASRDGAHLRMMRDKGYMQPVYQHASPYGSYHQPPYQPPYHPLPQQQHRGSLGQPFGASGPDTHVWTSPKAPTPSPISDSNTPGMHHQHQQQQRDQYHGPTMFATPSWGHNPSRPDLAPLTAHGQAQNPNGQGPMLPQMQPAPTQMPPAPANEHETWRYTR